MDGDCNRVGGWVELVKWVVSSKWALSDWQFITKQFGFLLK